MKWVFGTLLISDHLYLTLPSFYYLHNLKSYKVNTFLTLTFNRIPTSHGSSIRIRVRREDFQFEAGNYSLQPSITNHLYVYRHIWWTDWEEISRLSATHEESFTFEIFLKIFHEIYFYYHWVPRMLAARNSSFWRKYSVCSQYGWVDWALKS